MYKLDLEKAEEPEIKLPTSVGSSKKQESSMFIAALLIIARIWKQPRCPSADEWIRKQWYIYTVHIHNGVLLSH